MGMHRRLLARRESGLLGRGIAPNVVGRVRRNQPRSGALNGLPQTPQATGMGMVKSRRAFWWAYYGNAGEQCLFFDGLAGPATAVGVALDGLRPLAGNV